MRQAILEQNHLTTRNAAGFGEEPHSVLACEVVQYVPEDHGVERAVGEGQGLAVVHAELHAWDGEMLWHCEIEAHATMERAKERQLPQKVRVAAADIEDLVAVAQRLGHAVCFQQIRRRIVAILTRNRSSGVREPRNDALNEIDGPEGETTRARRLPRGIRNVGPPPRHVMSPSRHSYRGTMSVTCSPICRSLAGVSSSITCPACVCTFTRFVSLSTVTTVASTVPVTCPEVLLAPGRSSLLVWMSTIDCEGTSTSTILPSMSVTCQVCFAPSTCTTVARSGCPKALGETSVVTANTTPSRRIMPGQDW